MEIEEKMRVGIYDPYLGAVLGGGERYVLTLAECLRASGHQVDIFWEEDKLLGLIKEKLGIDLAEINFVGDIFKLDLFERWRITRRYDVIFFLSDGSLPWLFAKKNFIHMQVPLIGVRNKSLVSSLKKRLIKNFICNSEFTKKVIDKVYGVKSLVLYPPVSTEDFSNKAIKKNIILGVGRFTQSLHAKKQDVLVRNFKLFIDCGLKNWRLFLVGGALPEDQSFLEGLKKLAEGYPITI